MIIFKQEDSEDLTYADNEVEMFDRSNAIANYQSANNLMSVATHTTAPPTIPTDIIKSKTKRKPRKNPSQVNGSVVKVPTSDYEVNAALRAKLLGTTACTTKTANGSMTIENISKTVDQQQVQPQQSVSDNAVQSWPVDMSKVLHCEIDRVMQTASVQQMINQQDQQQMVITSTGPNGTTTVGQQVFVWPIDMSSYIT